MATVQPLGDDSLKGLSVKLPKIPLLGHVMPFIEWLPRVEGQAKCYGWSGMLATRDAQVAKWNIAKQWLIQWVPDADFHIVNKATCWVDAIQALKRAHTTVML